MATNLISVTHRSQCGTEAQAGTSESSVPMKAITRSVTAEVNATSVACGDVITLDNQRNIGYNTRSQSHEGNTMTIRSKPFMDDYLPPENDVVEDRDDVEEDDGQPTEYEEWQDYMGGDEYYDHSENGCW